MSWVVLSLCRARILNVLRMLNPNPTHLINVSCRVRIVFYCAGFESCKGLINNNMHVIKNREREGKKFKKKKKRRREN